MYLETDSEINIQLIKDVYDSRNLGVVTLDSRYILEVTCLSFIDNIIKKGLGNLEEVNEGEKPVNLLPILNLQRDIDRLIKHGISLESEDFLKYLTEINIFINNSCAVKCIHCVSYSKQTYSCFSNKNNNTNLHPEIVDNILLQASNSLTRRINILGGNILLYTQWNNLFAIFEKYDYDFHYWIHYLNLMKSENWLKNTVYLKKEILITFPLDEDIIKNTFIYFKNDNNTHFHFLIENESQFNETENYIQLFNLHQVVIIPIFTGKNSLFFRKNIFLEKEDILKGITQRRIFCNQKLNSNHFGKIYCFPDGSVKANMNSIEIGNVSKDQLLQIVLNEMEGNTAWRKIRNEIPCSICLYQYLCPSPSNYELVIGKPNFCHVKA